MNVYDLVFMACLALGQGSVCKQDLLKCVLDYRDQSMKSYLQTLEPKKQTPDQFLTSQPPADWSSWVLDCAQKEKAKKK